MNTYFKPGKGSMLKHTYILYTQAGFSSEYLDGCWHHDSRAPVAGGQWGAKWPRVWSRNVNVTLRLTCHNRPILALLYVVVRGELLIYRRGLTRSLLIPRNYWTFWSNFATSSCPGIERHSISAQLSTCSPKRTSENNRGTTFRGMNLEI